MTSSYRRLRVTAAALATVALSGTLLATSAGAASATPAMPLQSGHSVSGTVYEGGAWYRSSTVRTVSNSNDNIYLSFTSIPSHGIDWYLSLPAHSNSTLGTQRNYTSGSQQTLATNVLAGTEFQNNFKQGDTCNFNCGSYNFSGTETY